MTTEGGEFALTQNSCDEVLTIREAAGFLKLSDQHVRRLAEAGELPGRKLGDRWRFSRHALLRHLEGDVDGNRDRDGSREGASTEAT
jgi:excisionase family DNA binding protein